MSRGERIRWSAIALGSAIVISVAITSIALLLTGNNPISAFSSMLDFGFTRNSITEVFNRATPLYISGLAVAVGFKMNLFNIGVDGQYRIAAILAAWLGAQVSLPPVLHVPFICLVAMLVGAGWAGIAGALKVRRGVSEVISTIMLNFIATGVAAYLLSEYLREEREGISTNVSRTEQLPDSARIPTLNRVLNWFLEPVGFELDPIRSDVFGSVLLAVLVGVVMYVIFNRTRFGYDLRASGMNASAARASGVDPDRMVMRTMLMSGAIAGLVGIPQLLGEFFEFRDTFPSNLGFDGIAVALLGRNSPVGIAFAALLWGFLEVSSAVLNLEGIPPEIVRIMQGTVLLSMVIAYSVVGRYQAVAEVRAAAARSAAAHDHEDAEVAK
ncbi:MAG: ABC transporter permease [Acidimicrobiales bacterium]